MVEVFVAESFGFACRRILGLQCSLSKKIADIYLFIADIVHIVRIA